ncbi:uncharacterized protein LOC113438384 [Pseudonaja textilis]|uniref:uncharacterized protein LOC113438384 n=1 Tax=Pseudonaja textilis TaxID=8673 RepID=UPI000EAABE05|nr:uncharacterized protein LOC113438384 [Pseudonaja textilis]
MDKDQLQEPNSICSSMLREDAVLVNDSDKDATEGRDTSATLLPKDPCFPEDKHATTEGRDTSATLLPKDPCFPEDKDATKDRDTSATVLPKDSCLPEDKDATKDRDTSATVLPKDSCLPEDKDATKDRDTSATVLLKDYCLLEASKHLVGSKSKQKPYYELPPAYVLPYLVLIKNCLDLPFPTIKKQCLTGEILCKIDSLTLRRKKKKSPTSLELAKVPTLQETKYVTFEGLEDLQWKLFKVTVLTSDSLIFIPSE